MTNYSDDFKDGIFKEVEEIKNVAIVARKHSLPVSTIHTWLRKRDKKVDFSKNAKEREIKKENNKLKKQLSEKDIEIQILKDLLKKTYQVWSTD